MTNFDATESEQPVGATQNTGILHPHPIGEETLRPLREQAKTFLDNLIQHPLNSPGFHTNLEQLNSLGSALSKNLEFVLSAPVADKDQAKLDREVANAMEALNELVRELTPTPRTTIKSFFSGKKEFPYEKYFAKYENSQDTIDTVIRGLLASRDSLMKENGRLAEEQKHVFNLFNKVNEHEVFVNVFLEALDEQKKELRSEYPLDYLNQYVNDVRLVLNQKRQDFLALRIVTEQSYASLTITHTNNETLRRNLEHAKNVTMYALNTAHRVAQGIIAQKNLMNQVEGLTNEAEHGLVALSRNVGTGAPKAEAIEELTSVFSRVSDAVKKLELESSNSQN